MDGQANLMGLREKLVSLRQSFIGRKGGLAHVQPSTDEGREWLDWANEATDSAIEALNEIIEYLDDIIGD